ncbi:EF-hand domain-containing protein [Nocardiopsis algeriensis]|uniref:Ca2+-binding EF-hand superfamily protein n=1 Tax=Nocardiopsis algeriensis TaxID=1478215 RepID=A0A841IQT3_9ACTN|nr:EF-hand domain-containing protein [Nocardiopsis algeriensis]MBB6121219.1 Ca2+-binding EF-hand superfamily protein [Nocardiopsis algeriensis]
MTTATKPANRLEKRFSFWDSNGNGVIERSDFEKEANGIIDRLGAAGSADSAALKDAYLGMFDLLAQAAGTQEISREKFLEVAEREIIGRGDVGFAEFVQPTIQAIVTVLDTDGDGEVDATEMGKWFEAVGVDADSAAQAFSALDTDGSGRLSTSELVAAVRDYHLGRNDIPLLGA